MLITTLILVKLARDYTFERYPWHPSIIFSFLWVYLRLRRRNRVGAMQFFFLPLDLFHIGAATWNTFKLIAAVHTTDIDDAGHFKTRRDARSTLEAENLCLSANACLCGMTRNLKVVREAEH